MKNYMLTNEDKNQILVSFLETIEGISNKEYQERVWIRGEGAEVDDFDETVCHFFQEGDGIIQKYIEFGIDKNQYELLSEFRDKFKNFCNKNNWPIEFIYTSEWENIRKKAKELLKIFNYKEKLK